jgi:hypothetical protein
MKKQITIRQQSEKTIEVEMPSFYNFHGKYTAITEHAVIGVWSDGHMISFNFASNKDRYNQCIDDVMGLYSVQPCTQEEFETAFNNTIKCLTEQYQLSMNMQLDPNNAAGQQEEQATEQQNAQESASQDQAMEVDSEEGSTEG